MSAEDSPKVIRANSIVLEDNNGNPRIVLDAAGEDGYAAITLFSKSCNHQIQLSSQPDDRVEIALIGGNGRSSINIIVTPKSNNCSIQLVERGGESHTIIGSFPYDERMHTPDVTVFRKGGDKASLRELHGRIAQPEGIDNAEEASD